MTATTTLITPEDRVENIRRVSEVAKLMADSGTIVMPRWKFVKRGIQSISTKKAHAGEIRDFTGIGGPTRSARGPRDRHAHGRANRR